MFVMSLCSPAGRCALLALGIAAAAHAADPAPGSSPFLPPAAPSTEAAPTQDSQLELRGIMSGSSGEMFSIYDSAKRSSAWIRLNELGRDYVVRSYDPNRDMVTVEHQGRTLTLALKTAKVASAPVTAPQPAMPQPGGNAPQPVGGPVVLNPSPADEQRRLEAIAAEVNRRRMVRQQALQAQRQGQPPPSGGNQPR